MPDPGFQQIQQALADHLRDPERFPPPADIEPRRLAIYRRLFYNNVLNLLGKGFPILKAVLGPEQWARLVRDFYRDHDSHTPYFPQFGEEFVCYLAEERAPAKEDWPFMPELAHFERVQKTLLNAADSESSLCTTRASDPLSGVPSLVPQARLLAYEFPVHRIGEDFKPDQPGEAPTYLLAYRAGPKRVRVAVLNALGARLLWRIQEEPSTGYEQVRRTLNDLGLEHDETLCRQGGRLLKRFRKLGVLVVSAPEAVTVAH
ncbi:MAG: putative DNA-binding domain-containing protein [Thioalkalivibrio sp.]|nr:putative DNA-binding domain-containing protein [Thioalkalivibrio sp.]